MSKRTLIIDGNFMLKRFLRDYDFIADPVSDRNNYLIDLSQHIACEIERVKSFCDNIILCKDSRSWRKDVDVVRPLQTIDGEIIYPESQTINYKANRIQSEDRDWNLIYSAFNDFCECLNRDFGIPFICSKGAEGDDCIWATVNWCRANKIKTAVYCTDGDMNQLVSTSNVILRRIKSKAAPEGEVVLHPTFWEKFNASTDTSDPLALMNFNPAAWAQDMDMLKGKSLSNGIVITYPYWFVLVHMIVGSTKDNVPELFTWPAKSVNRHINSSHIETALSLCNLKKIDITEQHLYDEPFLKALIINLCHVTNQTQFVNHIDYLYKILCSNRKMNYLSEKEIPPEVKSSLIEQLTMQRTMKADIESLSKATVIQEALHVSKDKTFQSLGI